MDKDVCMGLKWVKFHIPQQYCETWMSSIGLEEYPINFISQYEITENKYMFYDGIWFYGCGIDGHIKNMPISDMIDIYQSNENEYSCYKATLLAQFFYITDTASCFCYYVLLFMLMLKAV